MFERIGLRGSGRRTLGVVFSAIVGVLAALLVSFGNPGNMGLCGACFVRDVAGALGLHAGPAIVRPEVVGIVLGALVCCWMSGRHVGRSGSHAVTQFVLGVAMAIAALVGWCGALCGGCPVRLIVLTGEGNGDAFVAVAGLLVGGAVAHSLGLAAAPASAAAAGGPGTAGKVAVVVLLVLVVAYGMAMTAAARSRNPG
ncbi:MAG: hypothetical protein NXI31_09390 [bacterium]|nr:hypothetical protein [bacterium]